MTTPDAPTRPPSDEKPPFAEVAWTNHAKDNWYDRAADDSLHIARDGGVMWDAAWNRVVPIHYPPARKPARGYYHPEADLVVLARPDRDDPETTVVTTCIALADRPTMQRSYVRSQVRTETESETHA